MTQLGKSMCAFPVAPRYAKMMVLGLKDKIKDYVTTLVAILSVRDPLLRFNDDWGGDQEAEKAEEKEKEDGEGGEGTVESERPPARRRRVHPTHKKWIHPRSDVLTSLFAVGTSLASCFFFRFPFPFFDFPFVLVLLQVRVSTWKSTSEVRFAARISWNSKRSKKY